MAINCSIYQYIEGILLGSFLTDVFVAGWLTVLLGTFMINHFDLFGLQQVYLNFKNKSVEDPRFVKRFLFAFVTTGYILAAIQLEERDMVKIHGNEYLKYQQEVSQIYLCRLKELIWVLCIGQNQYAKRNY